MNLQVCWGCRQGKHHRVFCRQGEVNENTVLSVGSKGNELVNGALLTGEAAVMNNEKMRTTRVFFDQGAQQTFILSALAAALELSPVSKINLTISGFVGSRSVSTYEVVKVVVNMGGESHTIKAVVIDNLPDQIRVDGLAKAMKDLRDSGMKLADPHLAEDVISGIGILVGVDHYEAFVRGKQNWKGITLYSTAAGVMPCGQLPERYQEKEVSSHISSVLVAELATAHNPITEESLEDTVAKEVSKLWELESIGIKDETYTPEESTAYESYHRTVEYHDHQYWVKMPFKLDRPYLPTNYHLARRRLSQTLKKLERDEEHLRLYDDIIKTQLSKGFIEKVPDAQVNPASHYLPHLAVIKESKTTPIRIVFDCSAKMDKTSNSLNDCLYAGPSLTEKLGKVLLKFRTNPYAFAADISKAFLRVGLQEEDRDYTRFLWPENPFDSQSDLVTYRFRSVLFGASCSPFLLQATLFHHLNKSDSSYAGKLKDSLYVDNVQGTMVSEEELLSFYPSANQTMAEANMPLQEWCTNSPRLQEVISHHDEVKDEPQKLLGMCWDVKQDTLAIRPVNFEVDNLTKRSLLSNLSKIFDPLGLLSPITVRARILMQETWKLNIGWDSILPEGIQKSWREIVNGSDEFSQINFSRETCREGIGYDLHVFCDASSKAYGAVVYVTDGVQTPMLVMSKAKVAPVKSKTLPQLELTALYVGVELQRYVQATLPEILFQTVYVWSDSEVALQWVRNHNCKQVYVRNRVSRIREIGSSCVYQHVRSEQNPADLLT